MRRGHRLPRFLLYSPRYLATPKGRWLLNQYLKWYLKREAKRWLRWRMIESTLREYSKAERESAETKGEPSASSTPRKTASRDII